MMLLSFSHYSLEEDRGRDENCWTDTLLGYRDDEVRVSYEGGRRGEN